MVILLDGLESLTDDGQALRWLPSSLPPSCSLVLSTTPGSTTASALKRRGWTDAAALDGERGAAEGYAALEASGRIEAESRGGPQRCGRSCP